MNVTEQFERDLIKEAKGGDAEAGREILFSIALAIDAGRFDSLLFPFLADCLMQFAQDGKPLEQALWVKQGKKKGRPIKYNETELAAVDILLRDYHGLSSSSTIYLIKGRIGADKKLVKSVRKKFDSRYNTLTDGPLMESLPRDILLHLSGSLRRKFVEILSQ